MAWSPDNRHFIYSRNDLARLGDIEGNINPLSGLGRILDLRFVDPAQYLYLTQEGEMEQLWLADLAGTKTFFAESSTPIYFDFVH